ncbi:oligosaccharide flippase family protein [Candidatus Roizmanbacteria bacterium]|nr:oligosaccharide flippase family protein [Candidatus Roizmanbacteria bacterium]
MKIVFIIVTYKTPKKEVERLRKEINGLGLKNVRIYFIDNTKTGKGYAEGANIGIRKGIKDEADFFIIANPDISLSTVKSADLFAAVKHFDVWGFSMKQHGVTYYGGVIDSWRMSGGLRELKPDQRFSETDWVSGSLMCIKREVIDTIGMFDERYGMYYEDVNFCYQARKNGFKVGIDSKITYEHFETSKNNPVKERKLAISRLKFLIQYGSFTQKLYEIVRLPKTFLEEIIKRPFYLNFFSLNFSSILNKILHFFLFLFLVRYLNPKEYGIYTLIWIHIGMVLPLLDFGTTSYGLIYLPKKEQVFSSLFSLKMFLGLIAFIVTNFLALVLKFDTQKIIFVFFTSFVIFANVFSGSFLLSLSVNDQIYLASILSLVFNLFLVIASILVLLFSGKLFSIFLVVFILYNLYTLANLFFIGKIVQNLNLRFDLNAWWLIVKKSSPFFFISLLATLYFRLDIYLLNYFKGTEAVGIYSSGYKFLDALMLIVSSYNVSALPVLSKLYKESADRFKSKIKKDVLMVGLIGVLIVLLFYLFGPVFLKIILFQAVLNFSLNYFLIPRFSFFSSAYITVFGELINTIVSFMLLRKQLKNI